MKRSIFRIIYAAVVFWFIFTSYELLAQVSTNNPVDASVAATLLGSWTNDLKSVLTIEKIDPQTGALIGNYKLNSASGLPPDLAFPLQGWVNTKPADPKHPNQVTVVQFSVRFGTIGSVTSWNGFFDRTNMILGQWLLSRPSSDYDWDHIVTGQDRFRR
jgi:hypothetical protein